MLWPCAIIFAMGLRERLVGVAPMESFLRQHPAYDTAFVCILIASFVLAPVLLIVGLFKAKEERTRVWVPFVVSLLAYAVGFAALLVYLRGLTLRPFLVTVVYLMIYSAALFLWLKRKPNRIAGTF